MPGAKKGGEAQIAVGSVVPRPSEELCINLGLAPPVHEGRHLDSLSVRR